MPFSIDGRQIGKGYKPYFVAEMSGNHNNDINRALKIIEIAKESGADAVKLQTYKASTITIDHNSDDFLVKEGLWKNRRLFELYEEASTPWEWHEKLYCHAKKIGISIFSSPFDFSAVDFLEELDSKAYKIASPEIVDLPLIERVCDTGKPIIISTGASSIREISEAISVIKKKGISKVVLLHCTAAYPAPLNEANLSTMKFLNKKFDVDVGLSDHTLGTIVSTTAVSLGASIIEKHFTLSRSDGGIDSAFSLEPSEFSELVKNGIQAYNAIGTPQEKPTNSESSVKRNKRSLYVVRNIKKGELFNENNIRSIRPAFGMEPKFYYEVIGKKAAQDLYFGEPLKKEMIVDKNSTNISLFSDDNNILITSSANKNPLIRSLKNAIKGVLPNIKIYAGDTNETTLSKFDADYFWSMPKTNDSNIKEIISYCKKNSIKFIFPTRDGELFFWSKHKSLLKSQNIFVFVASENILSLSLDKLNFFKFCQRNNFQTINTSSNIEDINHDKYVVKERFGSGSKNIAINFKKDDALKFSLSLKKPIFQPYVNCQEISIDGWVGENGNLPGISLRSRSIILNGESKVSTTINNPKLEKKATEFISKLAIKGPFVIQAFVQRNNLKFIECNPRIGGASTLSIKNGLNIFLWSILEILDPSFIPNLSKKHKSITQVRTQFDKYYYDSNF